MSTAAPIPVTGVAQAGRDRVHVMTGLTTHAGRPYLCGPALTCACAPGWAWYSAACMARLSSGAQAQVSAGPHR